MVAKERIARKGQEGGKGSEGGNDEVNSLAEVGWSQRREEVGE